MSISSSSRFTSFANRPVIANVIGGVDRLLGMEAFWDAGEFAVQSGIFRGALSDSDANSEFIAATRALWRTEDRAANHVTLFGVSLRHRQARNNRLIQSTLTGADIFGLPDIKLVSTSSDRVLALETYIQRDRLAVASEFMSFHSSNQEVWGGYVSVSWRATGKQQFDTKNGVYSRPMLEKGPITKHPYALEFVSRTEWVNIENNNMAGQQFIQSFGMVLHFLRNARFLIDVSLIDRSVGLRSTDNFQMNGRVQFFF